MKTKPRHLMTATVCMLVAALALGSAAQFGSAVVCVGSDGHNDVETLLDSCCTLAASHDEAERNNAARVAGSCGDCVDVQLRVPTLKTRESRLLPPDINTEGSRLVLSGIDVGRNLLAVRADRIDQHSESLFPLSTVVILT